MRSLGLLIPLLLLTACDDKPSVRQNLAQCKIDRRAHSSDGIYDEGFLYECMQALGFILDNHLTTACITGEYPQVDDACYRRDSWVSDLKATLFDVK
jgi:hypothetical protein